MDSCGEGHSVCDRGGGDPGAQDQLTRAPRASMKTRGSLPKTGQGVQPLQGPQGLGEDREWGGRWLHRRVYFCTGWGGTPQWDTGKPALAGRPQGQKRPSHQIPQTQSGKRVQRGAARAEVTASPQNGGTGERDPRGNAPVTGERLTVTDRPGCPMCPIPWALSLGCLSGGGGMVFV